MKKSGTESTGIQKINGIAIKPLSEIKLYREENSMTKFSVVQLIFGFLLLTGGIFLTFRQKLSYEKEGLSDLLAVIGLILMIFAGTSRIENRVDLNI